MNNSEVYEYDDDDDDLLEAYVAHWRMFVGVWELVTFLVGAPSNAFVAFVSCSLLKSGSRASGSYRNHHSCVLSMAVADLLFAVGHCPIMFAHYALRMALDGCGCRFMYFVTHCSTVSSSLSLLLLNLDRFICVRYPIRYYVVSSEKQAEALIVAGWMTSIAWSFFFIYGPLAGGFDDSCKVYVERPYIYYGSFVVTFFLLPITLSLLISVYVFVAATKARRYEHLCGGSHRQDSAIGLRRCRPSPPASFSSLTSSFCSTNRKSSSTAWKLRSVTFVFITTIWSALTLTPYRTAYLVFYLYREPWLARLAFGLFAVMIANAVGNPFITLLTQSQYRDKARTLLKKLLFARRRMTNSERTSENRSNASGSIFIPLRSRAMTM